MPHKKTKSEGLQSTLQSQRPSRMSHISAHSKISSFQAPQPATPTVFVRKKDYLESGQGKSKTTTRNNSVMSNPKKPKRDASDVVVRGETTPKSLEVLEQRTMPLSYKESILDMNNTASNILITQIQNLQNQLNEKSEELLHKDAMIAKLRRQVDQVLDEVEVVREKQQRQQEMRNRCQELEEKIQKEERDRYEQMERRMKVLKEENAGLRSILQKKDDLMKVNQVTIDQLKLQAKQNSVDSQNQQSQRSIDQNSQPETPNSDGEDSDKINGRLSLSGQKHFYATLVPENAVDMFGVDELRSKGRVREKPPVPKQKIVRKIDLQLLREKDRFLTKNGLKDFKQVLKKTQKARLPRSQLGSQCGEEMRSEQSVHVLSTVQSIQRDIGQQSKASGGHPRVFIQLNSIQKEFDSLNSLNLHHTDRPPMSNRPCNNLETAYHTPQNEKKSWCPASTKGKSTEQSSGQLARSSTCELLSQEVQGGRMSCSNMVSEAAPENVDDAPSNEPLRRPYLNLTSKSTLQLKSLRPKKPHQHPYFKSSSLHGFQGNQLTLRLSKTGTK